MPHPALAVHWPSQPWTRHNNAALARMLGCHENTVAEHRAVHAPHTTKARGRPATVDLGKADFTQHDTDIALIWNATRTRCASGAEPTTCQPAPGRAQEAPAGPACMTAAGSTQAGQHARIPFAWGARTRWHG